jgi:hypothetical protein
MIEGILKFSTPTHPPPGPFLMTCSQILLSPLGPDRQLTYFTNLKKQDCFGIGVFLFPPILWGRWSHDHPLEHLAKFGYRSDRKVENFRNPDILFWWRVETYCQNLTISEKKILKIWYFGPFFSRKSFPWVPLAFLFSPSWEILPQQKTLLVIRRLPDKSVI